MIVAVRYKVLGYCTWNICIYFNSNCIYVQFVLCNTDQWNDAIQYTFSFNMPFIISDIATGIHIRGEISNRVLDFGREHLLILNFRRSVRAVPPSSEASILWGVLGITSALTATVYSYLIQKEGERFKYWEIFFSYWFWASFTNLHNLYNSWGKYLLQDYYRKIASSAAFAPTKNIKLATI